MDMKKTKAYPVAVYWTLKRWEYNHSVMTQAQWYYAYDDYVEVASMWSHSFPMAKFKTGTKKWLKVEVYYVYNLAVLDWLEWYNEKWDLYNLYNRKVITMKSGKDAYIYEINHEVEDMLSNFLTLVEWPETYYNWSGNKSLSYNKKQNVLNSNYNKSISKTSANTSIQKRLKQPLNNNETRIEVERKAVPAWIQKMDS